MELVKSDNRAFFGYAAHMNDLQTRILDAALPAAVFDGWAFATLEKAAESIGLTGFDARRAFPGATAEALGLFFARADEQMVATLRRDYTLSTMKIRERIATAIMVRLDLLAPHREAVRRAIAFYALPWNAPDGVRSLYATVDTMWREAGDTSTDYNFYTKRAMLVGVVKSTVAVWLDDTSEGFADTRAFLDRRIENVMQVEKAKSKLRDGLEKLDSWLPDFMKSRA